MPLRHSTSPRRRAGLAAACAAVVLPVALATPVSAQTAETDVAGATRGSAVTVTLNLPQAHRVQLVLDPVSGVVRSVTGSAPEAQAVADLIVGSIGGNAHSVGRAEARLPEPTQSSGPAGPVNAGIAGTPLAELLSIEVVDSSAAVTDAPTSTSRAQIVSIGVGLPQSLVDALQPALDQVIAGIGTLLRALADGTEDGVGELCAGLAPAGDVTQEVVDELQPVPGVGPIAGSLLGGVDESEVAVLCQLSALLRDVAAELTAALDSLVGPGAVLSTGPVTARQSITTEGPDITAVAEASIADVRVLGQSPFVDAGALRTASQARLTPDTAEASVESAAVTVVADPLASLTADLDRLTGQIAGLPLDGVDKLVASLQAVFDGLLGIGVEARRLGSPDDVIAACPDVLDHALSGTYKAPDCVAAAARGYGVAITLPAQLAGPLGIGTDSQGDPLPFVELTIAPTAAVVQAHTVAVAPAVAVAPVVAPAPTSTLPRTGGDAPLAAAGLALLLGAAVLRRRRATAGA